MKQDAADGPDDLQPYPGLPDLSLSPSLPAPGWPPGPPLMVVQAPTDSLKANSHNARRHPKKQLRRIAESIKALGFVNPILVDGDNQILAGHGRWEAAKLLGLTSVPTLRISHLSPAQQRVYLIADNRLAEQSRWDESILTAEFGELLELDVDLQLTGFDTAEIDRFLLPTQLDDDEPPVPELPRCVSS